MPPTLIGYDCTDTRNDSKSDKYICGDKRLGPKDLPKGLTLGEIVLHYNRFGGKTPGEFLKKWTGHGDSYRYPPLNGFQLDIDGVPILGNMTLTVGTKVDRFGNEHGMSYAVIFKRKTSRAVASLIPISSLQVSMSPQQTLPFLSALFHHLV